MQAHFVRSLVVTWAYPAAVLRPFLPPGLRLHGYGDVGFLAVAVVSARGLRPVGWPAWMGFDVMMTGYRIFTRFARAGAGDLIGLRSVRSDMSSRLVARVGNGLTHYGFRPARAEVREEAGGDGTRLHVAVASGDGAADYRVTAEIGAEPAPLPAGSPFPSLAVARRFAGPLPNTFDYEAATDAMIVVEGVRQEWKPHPVRVAVGECGFLRHPWLTAHRPVLANAFLVSDVPYRWRAGVRYPLFTPAAGNGA